MNPYIRVLGSADWHVTEHNDNSCYTLCDRVLIDACSSVLMGLLNAGVDPIDVKTVCFTHMHADHCMGLVPLLHYWNVRMCGLGRRGDYSDLTIVGPKATLRSAVELALRYATNAWEKEPEPVEQMPKLVELEGGETMELAGFRISVIASDHAVPGLCYRFEDAATGRVAAFTGDTRYQPAFETFFRDADVLVHETSFGKGPLDEARNAKCRHSSVLEAIRVAEEARVRSLLLTHTYRPNREATLETAQNRLSIPVRWAMPEHTFEF